ncbi:MAG TPA: hypothetical protein VI588_04895 [Candidatus Gracilibacteria bacterium]|nr:hypothetical protein [Candidatus Gracilibacteria bacterium]
MTKKIPDRSATVSMTIKTRDRAGELKKFVNIFESAGINVLKTRAYLTPLNKKFVCKVTFKINNLDNLIKTLAELEPEIRKTVKWVNNTNE